MFEMHIDLKKKTITFENYNNTIGKSILGEKNYILSNRYTKDQ